MTRKIRYLNTDLNLEASCDLTRLAEALVDRKLLVLHVGQWKEDLWSARFETEDRFEEPDQNIAAMLTAVESLDEESRAVWSSCTARNFDMGYEGGEEPREFTQELTAATVSRIAAAGVGIIVTIYPVE